MPATVEITLAVMKCLASAMRASVSSPPMITMYAAITLPAMVEKPHTITHMICDDVICAMNGLMVSGASVCPTKMLAEADIASIPVMPSAVRSARASTLITRCIAPR